MVGTSDILRDVLDVWSACVCGILEAHRLQHRNMNLSDLKGTARTDPFLALDRLRSEFQESGCRARCLRRKDLD